jgi:hypothetical protein
MRKLLKKNSEINFLLSEIILLLKLIDKNLLNDKLIILMRKKLFRNSKINSMLAINDKLIFLMKKYFWR